MTKALTALPLVIALALVPAAGCSNKKDAAPKAEAGAPAAEKPVPVEVVPAGTRPVQRTVVIVGSLEAYEETGVANSVEAPVEKVHVDMGDRVGKGQLLVKLDDEEFKIKARLAEASLNEALARLGVEDEDKLDVDKVSHVKKAKAELENAERELKRMIELEKKGYISRSELDNAQAKRDMVDASMEGELEAGRSLYATVKSRRASLAYARKQLKDTEVRAPISGYVSKRLVDPGDYAKVGTELVTLVKVDPIRLRGEVPEVNAPDIKKGQEVVVKLPAAPDKEYRGRIDRISPASRPESRAFLVEARISNPGAALKPGYFAEASVTTRTDPAAVVVPLNSVVNFAGVNKVFVVEGGRAKERQVTTGARVEDMVEVSGVNPGEMVVVSGGKKLYDGKLVSMKGAGK